MVENYTLTSHDYQWLKEIIKNTESIDSIYKKLYELEINGQKDSKEYNDYLDYLKIALEVEAQIYESGKLDFNRGAALYNYIVEDRLPDHTLTDKESLIAQDYDSRVLRRILGSIKKIMTSDYKSLQGQMVPPQIVELMRAIGMPNVNERVSNAVYSSVEIKNAIDHDVFHGFLTFLRDLLNNSKYEEYKPNLIATKYNAAFVDKDVEEDLLEKSFELPEGFYLSVNFAAGVCDTPQRLLDIIKNQKGLDEATHHLIGLVKVHDEDFDDKNKAFGVLLRQCFVRSAFLLMDEELLGELNYQFHNYVESDEYLEENPNDSVGQQKAFDCFKRINEDKKKLDGGAQLGTI